MSLGGKSNSRGKWLAIALLTAGVLAALAEWKFRPAEPAHRVLPGVIPATAPASRES